MALRALMKRRDLDRLQKELSEKRTALDGFKDRELELETAITEAETDEERSAVEEAVDKFENERKELTDAIADLEERIAAIDAELKDIESKQAPKKTEKASDDKKDEKRGETNIMHKRNFFAGLAPETRSAMFAREDVKNFLSTVRTAIKEKRAIQGAGLLVPPVFLGLLRENIVDYSKLLKHVNLRAVSGEALQDVLGVIPEAVWESCCGKLNELDLSVYQNSVACWKCAGYFAVCNADLEDSDIDLASELMTALGFAIGYAADKAIVFGLGTRMPEGIFTSLKATSQPESYPATARPWVDLHTSNIKTIAAAKTGTDLFAEILTASGAAKSKYSRGEKVWIMNETTYTFLKAQAIQVDSGGAIVSQMNGRMPIDGGIVEVLDFMPDYMIVGGYLDLYLMAQRAGITLTQSEHVRFLDDQTVFKGTARFDGKPIVREGFVAIGVNGTTPSDAGVTFAPDTANESE